MRTICIGSYVIPPHPQDTSVPYWLLYSRRWVLWGAGGRMIVSYDPGCQGFRGGAYIMSEAWARLRSPAATSRATVPRHDTPGQLAPVERRVEGGDRALLGIERLSDASHQTPTFREICTVGLTADTAQLVSQLLEPRGGGGTGTKSVG
jgi:hypothetical protein